MSLKSIFRLGLRLAVLTAAYIVCFLVASDITLPPMPPGDFSPQMGKAAMAVMPLVAFLNTAMLSFIILRSGWHGGRLAATVFFIFYGVYSLLSQIETMAFPAAQTGFPDGLLGGLFLMGLVMAAGYAPLAVWILGGWQRPAAAAEPNGRLVMPLGEWAWRLAVVVVMYEILYFGFGYYVAWQSPAVRAFYGGTDPGSFIAQMGTVMRETPWMPFYQAGRALLWALLALPVIRMMKGGAWETALAVGLLFSVGMSAQLLFPSPYMPEAVRMAHLVETASSNFIFGALLTAVMMAPRPGAVHMAMPVKVSQPKAR